MSRSAGQVGRTGGLLAVTLSALLAACSSPPPPPPPVPQVATLEAPVVPPPPPHPLRKPQAPASVAPPGAPPPDDAQSFDRLEGLDQGATLAFLGDPEMRAESPPAVVWRYSSQGCELDVYFYLDLQSREMRVLHHEVRITDGSQRTQQGCYGELVAAHRPDQSGSADRPR